MESNFPLSGSRSDGGSGLRGPSRWFKAFFAFALVLGLSVTAATVYAVYLLFVHFGVIA